MRALFILFAATLVLLPACKRSRPAATSSPSKSASERSRSSPTRTETTPETKPTESEPGSEAGNREERDNPPSTPPPSTSAPGTSSQSGAPHQPQNDVAAAKGKMIIRVYGTPLEYPLDSMTIKGSAYRLSGQGMSFVGRASQNWRAGQSIAIEPRVNGIGESELDLPQVGKMKIVSGQIKLDEYTGQANSRVKGRIAFAVQGPDGVSNFDGTFEVGLLVQ